MSDEPTILIVAIRTDQPNIRRRIQLILAAAQPVGMTVHAEVFAKPWSEFNQGEDDALRGLFCRAAFRRLLGDQA